MPLCAQFELAVTNTMFRLPPKYKTTWMHPRSKHWHLIDFVIVQQRDLSQVYITRVMRDANVICFTDHRLVVTKLKLRLHPPRRSEGVKPKKLDIGKLQNVETRKVYAHAVSGMVSSFVVEGCDAVEAWSTLSSNLVTTASKTLGIKAYKCEDWFDDNDVILSRAIQKHRSFLEQHRSRRNSELVKQSGVELRRYVREVKDKWWQDKAVRMQRLADTGQLGEFYDEVRKLVGTAVRTKVPLRSSDGTKLLTNRHEVLTRWGEHFENLLNFDRDADMTHIAHMTSSPTVTGLDDPLSLSEVVVAIQQQQNKKAVGIDNVPGELLKYGGDELHQTIWKLFDRMWNEERVPDSFRVSPICSLYKNKGDRSDCNSYRGISLLTSPRKVFARILLNRLMPLSEDILPVTTY